MNIGRNGTLVAAAIYVIAVGVVISGGEVSIDPSLATSLELRQFVFIARTLPISEAAKPEDAEAGESGEMSGFLVRPLEDLARRNFQTNRDRLKGAAVAVAFGAPELVPLFVGPAAWSDPLARLLVEWSFIPGRPISDSEMALVRNSGLDVHLQDPLVVALADSAGLTQQAFTARASAQARWSSTVTTGAVLGLLAIAIMIFGSILWFRMRTWSAGAEEPPDGPLSFGASLPMVRVFVYFLVMSLTVGALAPVVAGGAGSGSLPAIVVMTYVATGSFGLWLVKAVGRRSPDQSWAGALGLDGAFDRSRLGQSAFGAVSAYCMIWPALLGTSILSSGLFGDGGGIFENPMAVFLVTGTDTSTKVLMLLSVAVLAPMFEEPLFRGFLYGRLRRHMRPVPAAAVSGLIFGAAHLSLANMLPLAAIGFTLALAYEKSRDLATPMIAHGAWNLVEALMLLAVFT